jgi:hypothetical protein
MTFGITRFLDFVHRPVFQKLENTTFRNLDLFPSSGEEGKTPTQLGPLFFFSFSGWGENESTWYVGHCWPIVPAPDDR